MYEVFDFDDFLGDPVGKVTGLVCVFYLKRKKKKKKAIYISLFYMIYNHWISKKSKSKITHLHFVIL